MWICPPCGRSNEPHAIFCAACGAMRTKAPARAEPSIEPPPSAPLSARLPAPPDIRLVKTPGRFALTWVGMSLAGSCFAWMVMYGVCDPLLQRVYRSAGASAWVFSHFVIVSVVHGWLVGFMQAK